MNKNLKPTISVESPVMAIYADQAFALLTNKEQNYAYSFLRASWEGSKVCWFQKSYESPALLILLQLVYSGIRLFINLFQGQSLQDLLQESKVTEQQFLQFQAYSAAVFTNCGNYQSFGDCKFIPEIPIEVFTQIVTSCRSYQQRSFREIINSLLSYIGEGVYGYEGKYCRIGFHPSEGQNGYYSQNVTSEDIKFVDDLLGILNISPLNTRVVREDSNLCVLVCSANQKPSQTYTFQNTRVEVRFGHLASFMRSVSENLTQALKFAANKNQENMIKSYVDHFNSGDVEQHKDSQRWWIKDQGPVVETNIGFIETYLDPKQVRAEFEGMVSLVDKKLSERTNNVVNQAEKFIAYLPWPSEFEKDKFLRPDFTSLQVLGFASSGTPLGINIPNYDDIRMDEGFKNVHLGNCVPKIKNVQFLALEDGNILSEFFSQALFHKVIYHELLGHGSGKLFQMKNDGTLNYDPNTIDPLTGNAVGSDCYKANDTWSGKFQNLSNPYEECRADSVALFYSCFKEAYEVLQPEEVDNWESIRTCLFIEFIYAGLQGLQLYNVEHNKWGQAHTNGRWVIFQVLLEAGQEMIIVEETNNSEGEDWFNIHLKKELFPTIGFKAISDFIVKLQVYKSRGDFDGALLMFGKYSQVNEKFLRIRDIVIKNKKPRRLEVQGNIIQNSQGQFEYLKYPETFAGVIESYIDRFPTFDSELYNEWKKMAKFMKPQ